MIHGYIWKSRYTKKKAKQDFLLSVQNNSSPEVLQKVELSQDMYIDAVFYGVSQMAQW